MERQARQEVRERIAQGLETGSLDAVAELAEPLASILSCRLLALPADAGPLPVGWVARYARNVPDDLGRS